MSRASICKVRRRGAGGNMEKVRVHVRVEQWGEWSRSLTVVVHSRAAKMQRDVEHMPEATQAVLPLSLRRD